MLPKGVVVVPTLPPKSSSDESSNLKLGPDTWHIWNVSSCSEIQTLVGNNTLTSIDNGFVLPQHLCNCPVCRHGVIWSVFMSQLWGSSQISRLRSMVLSSLTSLQMRENKRTKGWVGEEQQNRSSFPCCWDPNSTKQGENLCSWSPSIGEVIFPSDSIASLDQSSGAAIGETKS